MSDGNFNTKLLAPGGFASGVRSGEARMKQRALLALRETLNNQDNLTEEDKAKISAQFKAILDK